MPLFSVIIPLYNKALHIEGTLNSVLQQTFKDFEVIVVNDGSEDNSKAIVEQFTDLRISIYSIKNSGVSKARNYGVSKAKADLIAFIDADDLWLPKHLEELKSLYDAFPNCGMYAKAYKRKSGKQLINSNYKDISDNNPWQGVLKDYFHSSILNSIAHTSSVMIPKLIFSGIGGFNEHYNSGEDTDLWIRLALNYPVAFSNSVSSIYTINISGSITSSNLLKRSHFNTEAYLEEEQQNTSLKKYLDNNRLSLAFQHKLNNNTEEALVFLNKIDKANINELQRFLLKCPSVVLKLLLYLRNRLRVLNLDLRLFK